MKTVIAVIAGAFVALVKGDSPATIVFYGILAFIGTMIAAFVIHLFLSPREMDKARQEELKAKQEEISGLNEQIRLLQERVRNAEPRIKGIVREVYVQTTPIPWLPDKLARHFLIEVSLWNNSQTPTTLHGFRLEVVNDRLNAAVQTTVEHLSIRRHKFIAAPHRKFTDTFEEKMFALETNLVLSSDTPRQGWLGFTIRKEDSESVRSITLKIVHSYGIFPIEREAPFLPAWDTIVDTSERDDKEEG